METTEESLEKGEGGEDICSECGCLQEDPSPAVRIEPAGKSNGAERVNVTFETSAGFMDVVRGIVETSGRFLDLDHYIQESLHQQARSQIASLREEISKKSGAIGS